MKIIISSNSKTSDKDSIELKNLLSDIQDRFNFNWYVEGEKE